MAELTVEIACRVCLTRNRVTPHATSRCGACLSYIFTREDVIDALRAKNTQPFDMSGFLRKLGL